MSTELLWSSHANSHMYHCTCFTSPWGRLVNLVKNIGKTFCSIKLSRTFIAIFLLLNSSSWNNVYCHANVRRNISNYRVTFHFFMNTTHFLFIQCGPYKYLSCTVFMKRVNIRGFWKGFVKFIINTLQPFKKTSESNLLQMTWMTSARCMCYIMSNKGLL